MYTPLRSAMQGSEWVQRTASFKLAQMVYGEALHQILSKANL
jgi:hypothetical protein